MITLIGDSPRLYFVAESKATVTVILARSLPGPHLGLIISSEHPAEGYTPADLIALGTCITKLARAEMERPSEPLPLTP